MQEREYEIIRAEEADVKDISAIEKACVPMPWSYESIYDDVVEKTITAYFVAKNAEGFMAGFGGMFFVAGEAQVTSVAVLPEERRKGLGEQLLAEMVRHAKESGCTGITLEVRVSNTAAIRLYQKLGFIVEGTRSGYYSDTHEDAYIMWLRFE